MEDDKDIRWYLLAIIIKPKVRLSQGGQVLVQKLELGNRDERMAETNSNALLMHKVPQNISSGAVHPAWSRLMRYCAELRHGEIEKLKIQDGLPVIAEVTIRKSKFSP